MQEWEQAGQAFIKSEGRAPREPAGAENMLQVSGSVFSTSCFSARLFESILRITQPFLVNSECHSDIVTLQKGEEKTTAAKKYCQGE